jgi:hypothetical protein
MAVAVETKLVTHRISGTLMRSIHAAEAPYIDAEEDNRMAPTMDLMASAGPPEPIPVPFGEAIEVGSWLSYACAEWVGRGHPGLQQGVDSIRGSRADGIVMQAFREERL